MDPREMVQQVQRSQQDLLAALRELADADIAAPSLLPGWSRGHVLTHLSRNAEAIARMARAAGRDEQVEMYVGGPAARDAAIESGADRSAAAHLDDLRASGGEVLAALQAIPDAAWSRPVEWRRPATAASLPRLRWGEVEVHRLDLGLGYRPADWPAAFVAELLAQERPLLGTRAPGVHPPDLPDAELLAWILGRHPAGADLPELPAWP